MTVCKDQKPFDRTRMTSACIVEGVTNPNDSPDTAGSRCGTKLKRRGIPRRFVSTMQWR